MSCSTGCVQWTRNARNFLKSEIDQGNEDFVESVEIEALFTLKELNKKRLFYGLKPLRRISKDVVKQTIINMTTDDVVGDARRNELKDFETFEFNGGMYQ